MMFKVGKKVAIKIFTHPEVKDTSLERKDKEEYEASLSHFNSEEVYLKALDHPHIVKVYETNREVEVNVP
jgi:serine/threonine protein kinase